jgi:FAD/FMN-containing dehydrogenase
VGAQVSLPARRAVGRPFRRRLLGHHRRDDRHQAHGFSHIRQQGSGVYEALEENNVTITHRRCPQVGVAGFLLGGGIGFNIRAGWASGIDALVASEIVTASGDILPLSQREESRPVLGLPQRGGGNFGINTSFSLRTFPVPASVTASRLIWKTDADRVFLALMASLDRSPASLGSWTAFSARSTESRSRPNLKSKR